VPPVLHRLCYPQVVVKLYSELSKLRVPEVVRGVPDELAAAQRIAPAVLRSTHDGELPPASCPAHPPLLSFSAFLSAKHAVDGFCRGNHGLRTVVRRHSDRLSRFRATARVQLTLATDLFTEGPLSRPPLPGCVWTRH
jgi:hypothetical protein